MAYISDVGQNLSYLGRVMLDLEKAFNTDRYEVFLRAEQEMPAELLEDAYNLFWKAIEKRKYRVAKFLMRKPYFSPFLSTKPKNWVSLICKIPELLQVACEKHINRERISDSDAIVLIKASLKMRFLNKKGIKCFIETFAYDLLSDNAKYQSRDLLGRLLCQDEWYWARKLIDWGVNIDEQVIKQWAKTGLSIPSKDELTKDKTLSWPNQEIEPYKKDIILSIYRLGDEIADEFVINNKTAAFFFTAKIFSKDKTRQRKFLIATVKSCLSNPKSELANVAIEKFPRLLLASFQPTEQWLKKAAGKQQGLTPIEQFIIRERQESIQDHALQIGGMKNEMCPKSILTRIKKLPKHIATLILRKKAQDIGLERLVPEISRKEHIDMLLTESVDPFVLMTLSTKESHQAYLMEKLSEL